MSHVNKSVNTIFKIVTNRSNLGIWLFSILACIVLLVSLVLFAGSMGRPFMGIAVSWTGTEWVVVSVETNGAANQSGIIKGDRPVIINGQPADNYLEKNKSNEVVSGRFFKELTVIDTAGEKKSVTLAGMALPWQAVIEQFEWLFLCLIFWITGFYIFFKRPQIMAALLFCLCGLDFGLVLSSSLASSAGILGSARINITATIFAPWLLLHYMHVLPEERMRVGITPFINFIYIIPLVTAILFPFFGYKNGEPVDWFRTLSLVEYGIGLILVLSVAIFNYVHYVSPRSRQQMKIIMICSLAALLPMIGLTILPQVITGEPISNIGIIFLVFIPVGFGYAVITQKLMDIDVIIRRSIIYGLITLFMAAIFSVGVFFVLRYESALSAIGKILIAVASGLIASILFGPVKKGIEVTVDRFFYKDRYDYHQVVKILSASLNTLDKFTDISRIIISTIVQTLNIAGACLLVYAGDSLEASTSQGIYTNKGDQKKLINIVSKADEIVKFPHSASGLDPQLAFIVPLKAAEKEIGLLCLSQKISKQKYTSDDIYLIQGIMSVSAIALRSAMLLRDASDKNTVVDVISDKIRQTVSNIIGYSEFLLRSSVIEHLRDPLIHLLRNAVDHGIESLEERLAAGKPEVGTVRLSAYHEEDNIIIKLKDDGKGISPAKLRETAARKNMMSPEAASQLTDAEAINLIFGSGFSTAQKVTEVSGRGVGLDVVKTNIEILSGSVNVESVEGQGTTFTLMLPLTLAIIPALLVSTGSTVCAVPLSSIVESNKLEARDVKTVRGREVTVFRGNVLPLLRLDEIFGWENDNKQNGEATYVVVVKFAGTQVGLTVDALLEQQELVVKSLDHFIGGNNGITGASILGDGRVVLILDVASLVRGSIMERRMGKSNNEACLSPVSSVK